jgi:predicted DNA-binding transcriptional regulator YafY
MGRKSSTRTVSAILIAFLGQRTWRQSELARVTGVETKTLRRVLDELGSVGLPLERDEEPPHVYWSIPSSWFPGGVAFHGEQVQTLLRLLLHAPEGPTRDELVSHILNAAAGLRLEHAHSIVTRPLNAEEEHHLWQVEEGIEAQKSVQLRYFSMSGGEVAWRFISPHRVFIESPPRMVATCHRDRRLKWFRFDNVLSARVEAEEPFLVVNVDAVDRFVAESADGFHSGAPPIACRFRVRLPAARWVQGHLSMPMETEELEGEVEFRANTSGVLALARFLVGLGRDCTAETPELAALIRELAEGALDCGSL